MKFVNVEDLVGNEVLARSIISELDIILMNEGIQLKKEYIERLKELHITDVYIKDDEKNITFVEKNKIKENVLFICKKKVQNILERNIYKSSTNLKEICSTAGEIIENVLQKEEVLEKVYEVKNRNADIYEHSVNVCFFSIIVALKFNLPKEKVSSIGVSSLLHDIGLRYITVPYYDVDLISLSSKNLLEYKKHPVYGYSSISGENWLDEVSKNIILSHHERMDGSGFPLKTKDISPENKIVSVCDTFDEMICGIGYGKLKIHEAIEYLKSYKNIMFDGQVVDTFLSFVAAFPIGTMVKTNEGEVAVVIAQNEYFTERPVIKVLRDKNGKLLKKEKVINLVEVLHIFIDEVLD